MASAHQILVCQEHGTILLRCRCPGPHSRQEVPCRVTCPQYAPDASSACGADMGGIWVPKPRSRDYIPLHCNRPKGHAGDHCYYDESTGYEIRPTSAIRRTVDARGSVVG